MIFQQHLKHLEVRMAETIEKQWVFGFGLDLKYLVL